MILFSQRPFRIPGGFIRAHLGKWDIGSQDSKKWEGFGSSRPNIRSRPILSTHVYKLVIPCLRDFLLMSKGGMRILVWFVAFLRYPFFWFLLISWIHKDDSTDVYRVKFYSYHEPASVLNQDDVYCGQSTSQSLPRLTQISESRIDWISSPHSGWAPAWMPCSCLWWRSSWQKSIRALVWHKDCNKLTYLVVRSGNFSTLTVWTPACSIILASTVELG